MKRFILLSFFFLSAACLLSDAQELKFIGQDTAPSGVDCCSGYFAYFNGNQIYVPFPHSTLISTTRYPVSQVKVCPGGKTVTVICGNEKLSRIFTYALKKEGEMLYNPKFGYKPVSVSYSSDGQTVAVADSEGGVHIMDSAFGTGKSSFDAGFVPSDMVWNSEKHLLALYAGTRLQLRSVDDGGVVKEINAGGEVNGVGFSSDGRSMAVIVTGGDLYIYDTDTFTESYHVSGLGEASSMALFPESGCVAVVTGPGVISFVNPASPATVKKYVTEEKNITDIFPLKSFEGAPILCFVTERGFWKDDVSGYVTAE